jgi:hypothetical protein
MTGDDDTAKYLYPLCSWVYHIKFTIVEELLLLGFELELYQPYEYIYIYKYLPWDRADSCNLCNAILSHEAQLERIRAHTELEGRKSGWIYVNFLIGRSGIYSNLCAVYTSVPPRNAINLVIRRLARARVVEDATER